MSVTYYIPDGVYEVLPVIYIVSGIAAPFFVNNGMALFSGVLLVSAGLLVFNWRSTARHAAKRGDSRYRRMNSVTNDSVSAHNRRRRNN